MSYHIEQGTSVTRFLRCKNMRNEDQKKGKEELRGEKTLFPPNEKNKKQKTSKKKDYILLKDG